MVCDFVTMCVKYLRWLFGLKKKDKRKREEEGKKMFKVAVEKSAVLCCANRSWTDCIALAD